MTTENLPNDQLVRNLAAASAILAREAETLMPSGAAAQRKEMIGAIEKIATGSFALAPSAYDGLRGVFAQISNLELSSQIIEWIHSTHSLPEITPEMMEDAGAALSIFAQRLLLQSAVKKWVQELQSDTALTGDKQRNARLMIDMWVQKAGMSEAFVNELSRTNLASFRIWETAKPLSDFASWLPAFKQVVECARRKAVILGDALTVSPYQALLEQYNAGLKNETVNSIFAALHQKLPGLVKQITAKQAASAKPLPLPPVKVDIQKRILDRIITALGFETAFSRLDESMHPFSCGEWDDVRVTTHYHEDNLLSAITSVVHEMGHLFYSRNLPRAFKHQLIGAAQSTWIHESQSLFWEKQVGCSHEFMAFVADIIAGELGAGNAAFSADNLYALITRVEPGFIRIEADEVTYPAHVILRHRVEQAIIAGTLQPENLPQVWAEEMQQLLGVTVPDHAHGCMQDVHWSDGSFGYFPGYTFGALAAAQFMEKARDQLPDIAGMIRRGEFAPIQNWLKTNIHEMGSRYDGEELVQQVTGKPLSINAWLAHIDRRYVTPLR